uniref:Uncharacterized protein n=1 Tax=Sipha flava TaxID=143950 RepID=A0A2S2R5S2_9HEMI
MILSAVATKCVHGTTVSALAFGTESEECGRCKRAKPPPQFHHAAAAVGIDDGIYPSHEHKKQRVEHERGLSENQSATAAETRDGDRGEYFIIMFYNYYYNYYCAILLLLFTTEAFRAGGMNNVDRPRAQTYEVGILYAMNPARWASPSPRQF